MPQPRKTSGLEKVPPIVTRPLIRDSLFWWGVLAAVFWAAVLWWLFG